MYIYIYIYMEYIEYGHRNMEYGHRNMEYGHRIMENMDIDNYIAT